MLLPGEDLSSVVFGRIDGDDGAASFRCAGLANCAVAHYSCAVVYRHNLDGRQNLQNGDFDVRQKSDLGGIVEMVEILGLLNKPVQNRRI